jgi:hypothetical protein
MANDCTKHSVTSRPRVRGVEYQERQQPNGGRHLIEPPPNQGWITRTGRLSRRRPPRAQPPHLPRQPPPIPAAGSPNSSPPPPSPATTRSRSNSSPRCRAQTAFLGRPLPAHGALFGARNWRTLRLPLQEGDVRNRRSLLGHLSPSLAPYRKLPGAVPVETTPMRVRLPDPRAHTGQRPRQRWTSA